MPLPESLTFGVLELAPSNDGTTLFTLRHANGGAALVVSGPAFRLDGGDARGGFRFVEELPGHSLASAGSTASGGFETDLLYASPKAPGVDLHVIVRSFPKSPILRIKYRLAAGKTAHFSGPGDGITYFRLSAPGLERAALAEYQLSHFDPVQHSYIPYRDDRRAEDVLNGLAFVGPVALFHTPEYTVLAAYEHGADHPNTFFDFAINQADGERSVTLAARKANTYDGQAFDDDHPWESVWFELGLQPGPLRDFLPVYRRFFLEEVCENRESRRPYIYYNTWNYQERQKYFKGRPYLESMHAERMLAEIDIAHRMGVDVFVVDTGWYQKTGDWLPNLERFPEGLKEIKRRLDGYGMKLGLWFNPTVSALTSKVFQEHPEWEMTWGGSPRWRGPVWETEESTGMCLASDYADYYVDVMVRMHEALGVSYFKWDAVQQYGCDSPLHNHGTQDNLREERAESYAYEMGRAMIHIVEAVTRRCPGVIVDFDITEGGRFVGLGFLSAGKFFLVNNGPYFKEFDLPDTVRISPDTINVFFYPGPARPRICRTGARYDELIPSILFLTHYLPDAPALSQRNSLAAMLLGGNGIWGDLPALSEADLHFWNVQIGLYRRVAEGATRAYPTVRGFAGSSPEIHDKIDAETCAGLAAFFTVTPGTVTHITQPLAVDNLGEVVGADAWEVVEGNRLKMTVHLERDDARVVYVIPVGGEGT